MLDTKDKVIVVVSFIVPGKVGEDIVQKRRLSKGVAECLCGVEKVKTLWFDFDFDCQRHWKSCISSGGSLESVVNTFLDLTATARTCFPRPLTSYQDHLRRCPRRRRRLRRSLFHFLNERRLAVLYLPSQMTSRPPLATKHRRPLSAIFLGNVSQLPDLPDPPSSPNSSGLPSPPATNSTGSGSNGGDTSQESVELPPSLMQNGKGHPSNGLRSLTRSPINEGDDVVGEDNTARLLDGKRPTSSESQSALQRVRNLAQRNQMVRRLSFFVSLYLFIVVY